MELNKLYNMDCLELMRAMPENSVDSVVTDPPYGIFFLSSKWDYQVPSVKIWQEVYRVLKPGGYILVACGTRTQHRMACNIEDAGFFIRDCVLWLHAMGMPKGLDVSKAIDKELIAPAIKEAAQWQGWNTTLKPACEIFTLAQKPISESTIAKNVLRWGVGALNVDACRIETADTYKSNGMSSLGVMHDDNWKPKEIQTEMHEKGRWPANLVHDGSDEVMKLFPDTKSGNGDSVRKKKRAYLDKANSGNTFKNRRYSTEVFVDPETGREYQETVTRNDSGSAARFFYCAKISPSERGESTHPTMKPIALMEYLCKLITPVNGLILEPFAGSGTTCVAAVNLGFNFIASELSPEYCQIANKRIFEAQQKRKSMLF